MAGALIMGISCLGVSAAMAEEDHLKGYKIKDLNQVPPANPYTVTNEFGSESCQLKKPEFFLVQSEKDGGDDGRGGEPGNFVCYKAKCTGTLPVPTAQDSQFGLHSLETKKAKLVCLPVDPPSPFCLGAGGQVVGPFCWFLGLGGDSCNTVCGANLLTCDTATNDYAGSPIGTLANCDAVLDALVGPGTATDQVMIYNSGVGCAQDVTLGHVREVGTATTCSAVDDTPITNPARRACACQ